jgi:hypothetical protein
MVIYQFPTFQMQYEAAYGIVTTLYPDNCFSRVETNADHHYHADYLGIEPNLVNLQHELVHHLLAMAFGENTCPIIYNSAHSMPMLLNAQHREWEITAMSYFSLGKPFRPQHEHEWKAIFNIAQVVCPYLLKKDIYRLLLGYSTNGIIVKH